MPLIDEQETYVILGGRHMRVSSLVVITLLLFPWFAGAEALDYSLPDPELKLVRLDTSATDSFLAVRADTTGRLFVGGREELFVYEPDDKGGYKPRRSLYKFPNHTWVYDIAVRGNDLYVMTVSAMYLIPDAVTKREGLKPKRLIWGVPTGNVHQCFHGLAWGPEGDLYFSMGDPVVQYGDFGRPDHWMHWTFCSQPDGTKTPYTGVGGVFRCRPDGSKFQVVARGTRNSVGLTFDRHWNLFTNDNDHESIPSDYVPGRLLHVIPHAYFSWPRGWLVSKTPDRADLLETMTDGLGRFVPVGQAYYHDTYLPAKYRDNLLVARWCTRAVTRYPLQQRGASFKTEELPLLVGQKDARPVGVAVGRGGRIFVTIAYMPHNDMSPTYPSDLVMITRADDKDAHPFEPYDATTATPEKLFAELSQPDWSRREAAHVELLRRGGDHLTDATKRLKDAKEDAPETPHLIWLSAARAGKQLLKSDFKDPILRLQACRAIGEGPDIPTDEKRKALVTFLGDENSQVQLAAIGGLFNLDGDVPEEVIPLARAKDTYLRQAATLLLAERASLDRLAKLAEEKDVATRLAGVLAAGFRLTLPPATRPLPDHLPLAKLPTPEGYIIQFADAKVDLRDYGRIGNFTVAEHWKIGKHSAEQEKLFDLLEKRLSDADEAVRLQAAHFLYLLNDPRTEPVIAKLRKESSERRLINAPLKGVNKAWVAGPFPDGKKGLETVQPPEQGAIDLSATYEVDSAKLAWKEATADRLFSFAKLLEKREASSCYAYFRLESAAREKVLLLVGSGDGVKVWHNGKEVWANDVARAALPFQDTVLLDLQPGSNDLLVRVHSRNGEGGLYLHYRAEGHVVARLPEKLNVATLAERLKNGAGPEGKEIPKEFLDVDWTKAAAQGDAKKGRQLFGALSCAKCHAITADAATTGGPSLGDARKRFTVPYLVESILLPSKQVSPVFRASLIEMKKGTSLTGLVVGETNEKIELLLPDATRKTILKSDIDSRKILETSPMPAGIVKTPEELRDLLAYLLSENPTPP
jgi:putative heme-binding domain-containing protein